MYLCITLPKYDKNLYNLDSKRVCWSALIQTTYIINAFDNSQWGQIKKYLLPCAGKASCSGRYIAIALWIPPRVWWPVTPTVMGRAWWRHGSVAFHHIKATAVAPPLWSMVINPWESDRHIKPRIVCSRNGRVGLASSAEWVHVTGSYDDNENTCPGLQHTTHLLSMN